jgi:hypothetical protein
MKFVTAKFDCKKEYFCSPPFIKLVRVLRAERESVQLKKVEMNIPSDI